MLTCSLLLPAIAQVAEGGTPAGGPQPEEVVARAVGQLVGLLGRDPTRVSGSPEVNRVAVGLFDVPDMARRTLSRHWTASSPEQRTEFLALFSGLLQSTFLRHVQDGAGGALRYRGSIDGLFATVTERSATGGGGMKYRLSLNDGQWKVYDLVTDGFSLISTYRTEFGRLVEARRFSGLLDSLRTRPEPRESSVGPDEERWRYLFLPALLEHLARRQ